MGPGDPAIFRIRERRSPLHRLGRERRRRLPHRPDRAFRRCEGRRILQRDPLYAQLAAPHASGDLWSRAAALRRGPRDRAQRSLPRLPVGSPGGAPALAASTIAPTWERTNPLARRPPTTSGGATAV